MSRFTGLELTEHPRVIALVVCDRIILDATTNTRSLIDIFDTIYARSLPIAVARLSIYLCLGRGTEDQSEVHVGLFSPSDVAVIGSTLTIDEWDAAQAEFTMSLQGVAFTEEGEYELQVFVAGHVLATRRIAVRIAPQPPEVEADSPTP